MESRESKMKLDNSPNNLVSREFFRSRFMQLRFVCFSLQLVDNPRLKDVVDGRGDRNSSFLRSTGIGAAGYSVSVNDVSCNWQEGSIMELLQMEGSAAGGLK